MKCGHCGYELQEGRSVCGVCGKTQAFAAAEDLPFRPALDLSAPADAPKTEASPKKRGPKNSIKITPPDAPMGPGFRPAEEAFARSTGPKHARDAAMPITPLPAGGFFKPAELEADRGFSKPIPPKHVEPKPDPDHAKPIGPRTVADLPIPSRPKPAPGASVPFSPARPVEKSWNWKPLACGLMALVLVIGLVYAIVEMDLFSGSGGSGKKKDRNEGDRFDQFNNSAFADDYYDDSYDDSYDDYYDDSYDDGGGGFTPQPYDCPACTGGWHDLCHGSGIYSNYGEDVECACDNGRCTICDGSGMIK